MRARISISTSMTTGNRVGFSMIEVMIAMVILTVGMLGLLVGINLALDLNTRNQLQDEGVQLANERMRLVKSNGAATLAAPFSGMSTTITRTSRIRAGKTAFTIVLSSSAVGGDSNVLNTRVSWIYKDQPFAQELVSAKQYH